MSDLKSEIKKLRFLHISVVASLAAFTAIAYLFVSRQVKVSEASLSVELELVFMLIIATLSIIGYLLFKRKFQISEEQNTLIDQFKHIRVGMIIQYAFVEGATILSLIVYLIFGVQNFFLFALLLLVYLIYLRPNDIKLQRFLHLEAEDESNSEND